jgi:hypothetical protein
MLRKVAIVLAVLGAALTAVVVSSSAADAAKTDQVPGNVLVTQRLVGRIFYIEGSVGYARILDRSGNRVAEDAFAGSQVMFSLGPGRYRLVSYQRPCDANCGNLGAPTDKCSKRFRVRAHHVVSAIVRVSPGSSCRVRVRYG